jgi:hypothetical protein
MRIANSPEAILDPMDGAENDIPIANDDNDSYELEADHIQATTETTAEGPTDVGTLPDDIDNSSSTPIHYENMEQSLGAPPASSITFTNMPNLDCPPALLMHNFAILHLPDFQGCPTVPVCISCRTVINSADYTTLRKHQCAVPDTDAQAHVPLENDDTFSSGLEPEDIGEPVSLTGAAPLDPGDIPPIEEDDGIDDTPLPESIHSSWQDLRTYFHDNKGQFVKVSSVRPPNIIPPILFLPVKHGYGCPQFNCSHAYDRHGRAQKHIAKHTGKDHQGDSGEYTEATTIPCTMQTLGTLHGKSSYFRVSNRQPDSHNPNEVLTQAEFVAQSFDHFKPLDANVALQGLPFKTPFFKRFDYQSIYPADQKQYSKFVATRINHVSPSYNRKQGHHHHLLAMVALVYTRTGGFYLNRGPHIVRRHLGNKLGYV